MAPQMYHDLGFVIRAARSLVSTLAPGLPSHSNFDLGRTLAPAGDVRPDYQSLDGTMQQSLLPELPLDAGESGSKAALFFRGVTRSFRPFDPDPRSCSERTVRTRPPFFSEITRGYSVGFVARSRGTLPGEITCGSESNPLREREACGESRFGRGRSRRHSQSSVEEAADGETSSQPTIRARSRIR